MSGPNIPVNQLKKVRDSINATSPSFCLAKWLQVTLHLQNGHTHSCHHPVTHKVELEDLRYDKSGLHNTPLKKQARKEMLEGSRPKECHYCWDIEDAHKDNMSDRVIKSAQPWAIPREKEVAKLPWDSSVIPSYVEVSFGNECNFKCAYCAPHISSSLLAEVRKFGPYSSQADFSIENLTKSGIMPYGKDENNPYVDAFWNWWPELTTGLKVFRITGGEPLLNPNTFRFLDFIKKNPMPELTIAINSNLGVPKVTFDRFLEEVKYITENKLVKEFQLFTSVDTHGKNAEFIRFGLNYDSFMNNVRTYLDQIKNSELIFMCAYNAFSVINFNKFLKDVTVLKTKYFDNKGNTRVTLDIPYLKDPSFLSCYVLTNDFTSYILEDIKYLKQAAKLPDGREIFYETEISKLERIAKWIDSLEENEHRNSTRKELIIFLKEYEERKDIKIADYLPEYHSFLKNCASL